MPTVRHNSDKHIPSGVVQGDSKPLADKGTGTGVTDTYGADISGDACNCISENIGMATHSDGKMPA